MTTSNRPVDLPSSGRSATPKLLRAAVGSILCTTAAAGCASRYDGPTACDVNERETILNARLPNSGEPSAPFDITGTGQVFVAVTDDPTYNLAAIVRSVKSLYLLEDGAEPSYALDPDRQPGEYRQPIDPEIEFQDTSEYRVIDVEPGSYRLYSNLSNPMIDVVRCP